VFIIGSRLAKKEKKNGAAETQPESEVSRGLSQSELSTRPEEEHLINIAVCAPFRKVAYPTHF